MVFPELTAYFTADKEGAIIAVGVLLALTTGRAEDARPPALLQRLLQSQKIWHLLDPRVDLPRDDPATLALIESQPPWIVRDLDHDGRDDVAAVVVSGPPARRRFGVVAVHAAMPRMPKWVAPLKTEPIVNVFAEPFADAVAVYYCTECDAQPWFRWSGRSYELGLFATGDTVVLGDPDGSGGNLLVRPVSASARRAHVEPCAKARVHDVAGRPGARWYFVETTGEPRQRGWVIGRTVLAPDDCF